VKMEEILLAFVDNAFRTVSLVCNSSTIVEGITMLEFKLDKKSMENSTLVPSNAAFYQFGPSGVANLSATAAGTPLFLSKPHFLDADSYYLDALEGLSPDRTKHDTTIYVEPITGTTMKAAKRLQLNVMVQDVMLLYPNMELTYIPVAWIEDSATITPKLAKEFRDAIYSAQKISKGAQYGGFAAGAAFLLIGIVLLVIRRRRTNRPRSNSYQAIN